MRHQGRGRHDLMPVPREIIEEGGTNVVCCGHGGKQTILY
ncbi:hypothetical protein SXCC_03235 [Gluconacetobacter sp. SXCC-1]|nr:hypothetical protein SXCC_03235 [Gluconacetobacter sp. SXCC-1]